MATPEQEEETEARVKRTRRTYGRGFFDGLRTAGIVDVEGFMNNAKMQAAENGLTGTARKVLQVIPTTFAVTTQEVMLEVRKAGHNIEFNILEGCLKSLMKARLVVEPRTKTFQRIPRKTEYKQPSPPITSEIPVSSPAPVPAAPPPVLSAVPKPDPNLIDRLANVSTLLRRAADEIEAVALDIDGQIQAVEKKYAKLNQLQELLKSIGDS